MQYRFLFLVLPLTVVLHSSDATADRYFHGGHFGGGFHGHRGFGLYFGLPFFPRYYSPYPYYPYYAPPVVPVPATPPVYIERSPPINQALPNGYWYYCNNPPGYYPYVTDCASGWTPVDPVPPR